MTKTRARIFLFVLDGLGCGPAPDWAAFNHFPGSTLPNVARSVGGLHLPNLQRVGLGNIATIEGIPRTETPTGAAGRAAPAAQGCDTHCGILEILGAIRRQRSPEFRNGLPLGALAELEARTRCSFLGNGHARDGRQIEIHFQEHTRTGRPIVYVASPGVVLIVGHEDVIPFHEQHEIGRVGLEALKPYGVARLIVRPFHGTLGDIRRNPAVRRDFVAAHTSRNLLSHLEGFGLQCRVTDYVHSLAGCAGSHISTWQNCTSFEEQACTFLSTIRSSNGEPALSVFCLREFDVHCHARRPDLVRDRLVQLDDLVGAFSRSARPNDILILTADHGNDPTSPEFGHTRELVPVLFVGHAVPAIDIGLRSTLADVGATVAHLLGVPPLEDGTVAWDSGQA